MPICPDSTIASDFYQKWTYNQNLISNILVISRFVYLSLASVLVSCTRMTISLSIQYNAKAGFLPDNINSILLTLCYSHWRTPLNPIEEFWPLCVLSSHLFWTSNLWTHQPGSHRISPPSFCGACLNSRQHSILFTQCYYHWRTP